jgi:hypothetical protein
MKIELVDKVMGNVKPHYENFLKVQKFQFHSTSSISMAHMTQHPIMHHPKKPMMG